MTNDSQYLGIDPALAIIAPPRIEESVTFALFRNNEDNLNPAVVTYR